MAVVSVTQRWSQRGGSTTIAGNQPSSTLFITRDVLTNDPADDEAVVLLHPQVAKLGLSVHPAAPWLYCTGIEPLQTSPGRWEVRESYSGLAGIQGGNPNVPESPFDVPPTIRYRTAQNDEAIDQDIEGLPICTIVGEPFDPPLRQSKRDLVMQVSRAVSYFDPGFYVPYLEEGGAVSSDVIFGQPAGTVRLNDVTAESQVSGDINYWMVTWELQFRRGRPGISNDFAAWHRRVRAAGYYCFIDLTDLGGPPDAIVRCSRNGQPSTRPELHYTESENGHQAGEQIPVDANNPWPTAEWYLFQVYPHLPFQDLGMF